MKKTWICSFSKLAILGATLAACDGAEGSPVGANSPAPASHNAPASAPAAPALPAPVTPPTAPAQPPTPATPGAELSQPVSLPYVISQRPPQMMNYEAEHFFDNDQAWYWSTTPNPTFPVVIALQLTTPGTVTSVTIDPRVVDSPRPTDAPQAVTLEIAPIDNPTAFVQVATGTVLDAAVTTLNLATPTPAGTLRLTIASNHGGNFVVVNELRVMGRPAPAAAPSGPPQASLAFVIAQRPPEMMNYETERFFDNDPEWYWSTPIDPTFPVSFSLQFPAPATVVSVVIDPRVPARPSPEDAPNAITIEASTPESPDVFTRVASGTVLDGAPTTLNLTAPTRAAALRFVIASNHGGHVVAINELRVMGQGTPRP